MCVGAVLRFYDKTFFGDDFERKRSEKSRLKHGEQTRKK
jgi:hypothetical protein